MNTTFETALDKHEICQFFKGSGIYFARGSEWRDHLYISNWQEMCGVLELQKAAQGLLTSVFNDYLKCLRINYEDANSLFSNLRAYYIVQGSFPFLSSDNYDLVERLDDKNKKTIGSLFRLLRQKYDIQNKDLPKSSFEQEIQSLKQSGCPHDLEAL